MKNIAGLLLGLLVMGACSRDLDANLPKVQTNNPLSVTDTTFECGGTVLSDGGFEVTSRGICWSDKKDPKAVEGFMTKNGTGIGTFRSKIQSLLPDTRYYYRAYATNSEGTAYGEQFTFTTKKSLLAPTINSNVVTDVELTTALCGGVITSNGGDTIMRCGVCWDTNPNPTTSLSTKINLLHTTDAFTCTLTNLSHSTTYYVRAFAVNSRGVSYGENQSFKTKVLPAFDMISITGGSFQMGSNTGFSNESPVHAVTLSNFKLCKTEVTVELWNAVMPNSQYRGEQSNLPISGLSVNMAAEFLYRLSLATNQNYRLPTEAEWEYAAGEGSGTRTLYAAGVNDTLSFSDRAWTLLNASNTVHPVGMLLPNKLGLYDMAGNVAECCSDWMADYSSASVTNPKGPLTGNKKVIRGGSYLDSPIQCRTSSRLMLDPNTSIPNLGFRLALSN